MNYTSSKYQPIETIFKTYLISIYISITFVTSYMYHGKGLGDG